MQKIDYFSAAPEAMKILFQQEQYLAQQFAAHPTLNTTIWELVKLRASQINQCAFCIDMHSKTALEQGESTERLIGLSAWREMPHYSAEEQCALDWCETIIPGNEIAGAQFAHAVALLGEAALVDLTIAINAIQSWNRISRTFKPEVGSFRPT